MNKIPSYLRVLTIFGLVFYFTEFFIDSEKPAFIQYPWVSLLLLLVLFLLIAIEITYAGIENITYQLLDEDKKKAFLEARAFSKDENSFWKRAMKSLTRSKPIEEEDEIMRDHDFDGIYELDNALPPWWLYGFYLTIVFAIIYLVRFEILDGDNQVQEYEKSVAAAQLAIEEYKKNNPDLLSAENVELLTSAADLEKGKAVFNTNCVACHMADGGGGIGPNLTDQYWILGAGIKNVFNTVSEGGRSGKGMIPWKATLSPLEMQQVASYVISLQGTQPANPKDPEGDLVE
ncbi:MAG: cbb3-type cytochrome c oxidase N-terminal domain-containing protein [Flavobacteriaceae bacterium]|nr:cbb3-type cytochrome c oxidase N-terminal domain-containing protein [Flavobacteriaceae bacterium]